MIYFLSNLLLEGTQPLKNRNLHILNEPVNKTEKNSIDTVNDTVNDTVFLLLKQDNKLTAQEISDRLKMSLSTVKRKIKALRTSGKIERIGSDKTGYWKINDEL